jgi:type VI secretion system protein ImpH
MVLFKTNPSLGFAKSDINRLVFVEYAETIRVEITLNFLSIFGAASPLPLHYSEKILEDSYNEKILLDFLDMLNHRLKKLIYPIWEKQRYYIQYQPDLRDDFSKYILSMLGLYSQSQGVPTSLDMHKLLPFSGILSMHQKSSVSLLALLKHYFAHEDITIEEGIISRSELPDDQYVKLGDANCALGEDMCIGSFVLTRNLKFRIGFDSITWNELEAFSYNGTKKRELSDLMRLVQKAPLAYEISVTVKKEEIKPCLMGENGSSLGVNGWIGDIDEAQTIVVAAG